MLTLSRGSGRASASLSVSLSHTTDVSLGNNSSNENMNSASNMPFSKTTVMKRPSSSRSFHSTTPKFKRRTFKVPPKPIRTDTTQAQAAVSTVKGLVKGSNLAREDKKDLDAKRSVAERDIKTRLAWVTNKLKDEMYYTNFSTEQVETLDEYFNEIRWAAPTEIWRSIMNMWAFWGMKMKGKGHDVSEAAERINGYLEELEAVTTIGVFNLSRKTSLAPYPQHSLNFALRPYAQMYDVAMKANAMVGNNKKILELYSSLVDARYAIEDPRLLPPITLTLSKEHENEFMRRRILSTRRSELAPTPKTYLRTMTAALRLGDHRLIDAIMGEMLINKTVTPSVQSHEIYLQSLYERKMYMAIIEHMRVVMLHQPANPEAAPLVEIDGEVTTIATEKDDTLPYWCGGDKPIDLELQETGNTQMSYKSHFKPSRACFLTLYKSLACLYPITNDMERFFADHRGSSELVNEDMDAFRYHLYRYMDHHGVPRLHTFYNVMLSEAPSAQNVALYLGDLHDRGVAIREKARCAPLTPEELAAEKAARKRKHRLIVDLNKVESSVAFGRIFGRFADEARDNGLASDVYESAQKRVAYFLAENLKDFESTMELGAGMLIREQKDEIKKDLTAAKRQTAIEAGLVNPMEEEIERHLQITRARREKEIAREEELIANSTNDSLRSLFESNTNTASSLINPEERLPDGITKFGQVDNEHISISVNKRDLIKFSHNDVAQSMFDTIAHVRTDLINFGVPVSIQSEEAYLRSLILIARRTEPLPPLHTRGSTTLLPPLFQSPYVSDAPSDESTSDKQRTLLIEGTLKQRVRKVNANLVRREAQIAFALNELDMVVDTLDPLSPTDARRLDPQVVGEYIEALSELSVDCSILLQPLDASTGPNDVIDARETEVLASSARRVGEWCVNEIEKLMPRLTALTNASFSVTSTAHVHLLRDGKPFVGTFKPWLRGLAALGHADVMTIVLASAHDHHGIMPDQESFNLLIAGFVNAGMPMKGLRVLDLMLQASQSIANPSASNITSEDLSLGVIHGNVDEVIAKRLQVAKPIYPDNATVSLLLRALHAEGLLEYAEELWRRLVHRPAHQWDSLSALQEEKAIADIMLDDEPMDFTMADLERIQREREEEQRMELEIRSVERLGMQTMVSSGYIEAFNPKKNNALQRIQTYMPDVTRRKLRESSRASALLPVGAMRAIPTDDGHLIQLDASGRAVMTQLFLQMGHPAHAIQLYIDSRTEIPVRPIPEPQGWDYISSLTYTEDASSKAVTNTNQRNQDKMSSRRLTTARSALASYRADFDPEAADRQTVDPLYGTQWPLADTFTALAMYYLQKSKMQTDISLTVDERITAPLQATIRSIKDAVQEQAEKTLTLLRRFAADHPCTPMNFNTPLYSSAINAPGVSTNYKHDLTTLRIPYLDSTEDIYKSMDSLVMLSLNYEEALLRLKLVESPASVPRRWRVIYPTMVNQLRSIVGATDRLEAVESEIAALRESLVEATKTSYKRKEMERIRVDAAITASIERDQAASKGKSISQIETENVVALYKKEVLGGQHKKKDDVSFLQSFSKMLADQVALKQMFVPTSQDRAQHKKKVQEANIASGNHEYTAKDTADVKSFIANAKNNKTTAINTDEFIQKANEFVDALDNKFEQSLQDQSIRNKDVMMNHINKLRDEQVKESQTIGGLDTILQPFDDTNIDLDQLASDNVYESREAEAEAASEQARKLKITHDNILISSGDNPITHDDAKDTYGRGSVISDPALGLVSPFDLTLLTAIEARNEIKRKKYSPIRTPGKLSEMLSEEQFTELNNPSISIESLLTEKKMRPRLLQAQREGSIFTSPFAPATDIDGYRKKHALLPEDPAPRFTPLQKRVLDGKKNKNAQYGLGPAINLTPYKSPAMALFEAPLGSRAQKVTMENISQFIDLEEGPEDDPRYLNPEGNFKEFTGVEYPEGYEKSKDDPTVDMPTDSEGDIDPATFNMHASPEMDPFFNDKFDDDDALKAQLKNRKVVDNIDYLESRHAIKSDNTLAGRYGINTKIDLQDQKPGQAQIDEYYDQKLTYKPTGMDVFKRKSTQLRRDLEYSYEQRHKLLETFASVNEVQRKISEGEIQDPEVIRKYRRASIRGIMQGRFDGDFNEDAIPKSSPTTKQFVPAQEEEQPWIVDHSKNHKRGGARLNDDPNRRRDFVSSSVVRDRNNGAVVQQSKIMKLKDKLAKKEQKFKH